MAKRKLKKRELKKKRRRQSLTAQRRKPLAEWSARVRERDGYRCAVCGTDKYIQAHHLAPKAIYRELMFEMMNGISVCSRHHMFGAGSFHDDSVASTIWLMKNRPEQYAWVAEQIEKAQRVKLSVEKPSADIQ